MPKKIICFDLDGTLINGQGMIHPSDVKILATYRDSLLIPATGRSIGSVRQIFAKNGLFIGQQLPFPLILQNGAVLYAEGERLLAHFQFEDDVQAKLIRVLHGFPQVSALFFDLSVIYTLNEDGPVKAEIKSLDFHPQLLPEDSGACKFSKVMCFSDSQAVLDAVRDSLRPLAVGSYQSLPYALEICPPGVNKASGILQLVKMLGIEDYRLYAVGDSENDVPMLDLAHHSYAPTTAFGNILRRADQAIDASQNGILAPILG